MNREPCPIHGRGKRRAHHHWFWAGKSRFWGLIFRDVNSLNELNPRQGENRWEGGYIGSNQAPRVHRLAGRPETDSNAYGKAWKRQIILAMIPASVGYARTPEIIRRGLARHDVPGFRLARVAVDRRLQGKRLGGQLLLAAGRRCLLASAEVGGVVLVIDVKNERVAGWYASYGAVPLLGAPLSLLMPLTTIEAALKKAGKY